MRTSKTRRETIRWTACLSYPAKRTGKRTLSSSDVERRALDAPMTVDVRTRLVEFEREGKARRATPGFRRSDERIRHVLRLARSKRLEADDIDALVILLDDDRLEEVARLAH